MKDLHQFNKSLTEFFVAFQNKNQKESHDYEILDDDLKEFFGNIKPIISFPHLILEFLKIFRNLTTNYDVELSYDDKEMFEAFNEVVTSFPKWTTTLFGESIKMKFNAFKNQNSLKLSVDEKNKIYGHLGDIAFFSYLRTANHANPLIQKFSNIIQKKSLLDRIDFMLKLMKYDKNDLDHFCHDDFKYNALKYFQQLFFFVY